MARVFLYVQNLLGIGHVRRAAALARAMEQAGHTVTVASGGFPVREIPFGASREIQLPPVRTEDGDFKTLLGETGEPVDDGWRANRRDALLRALADSDPDVVITELFPFGRRQMRFELLPMLDAAHAMKRRPAVLSSMRDILVTKPRLDRNLEIVETIERYYDGILIHGDASVLALEETFPLTDRIADKLHYTGYVITPGGGRSAETNRDDGAGRGEIVVSAGGGAVGGDYMRWIFRNRRELPTGGRPWRFVAGPHMDVDVVAEMEASPGPGVTVERSRPDLAQVIARADLSISQAGYNTVMELLAGGTPAVVLPYEGGIETEQRLRADLLAKRGRLEVVAETDLSLETLSGAMMGALAAGRRDGADVALNGAVVTADLVARAARDRDDGINGSQSEARTGTGRS